MSPDVAAKLVEALDRELARRRNVRDEAEEKTWREEADGDEVVFFARVLDRFARRVVEPPAGALALPADEIVVRSRLIDDLIEDVNAIIEMLERWHRYEDRMAAGFPEREPIFLSPVRSAYKPAAMPNAGRSPTATKQKSRTVIEHAKREAETAARQALLPAPTSPDSFLAAGKVVTFVSAMMSGTVRVPGVADPVVFGISAFRRSGLTTLSPGMSVDVKCDRQPSGVLMITEIALGPDDRARSIAALEKQAQAAEERHRLLGKPH